MRKAWSSGAVVSLVLTGLSSLLMLTPAMQEFNRRISDSYFRLQTNRYDSRVVVVSIDDTSLQKYGRWPWSREILAQLVQKIAAKQPRAIGIDILLSEPQSGAPDERLRSALRAAGSVVLVDKITAFPDGARWVEPVPELATAAVAVGHAQAVLDGDGLCRSFPPEELSLEGARYAFALEVSRLVDPAKVDNFLANYGLHVATASERLLVARPTLIPIAFRRTPPTRISAGEVLAENVGDALRNKVVLVGFGAVEIGDRITTPVSRSLPTPGVEVHAHIVDSILEGRALKPLPLLTAILILFALNYAAVIVFHVWRGWKTIPILLLSFGAVYAFGFVAFQYAGRVAPVGTLMTGIALAPLVVYGVELAGIEAAIATQMRLLQKWLAYRQGPGAQPEEGISWKLRLLTELQEELGLRFELYRALLEATRDLVGVFDSEGHLLFANHAFNVAWRGFSAPSTLDEVRDRLVESKDAPLAREEEILEGEAVLNGELYSVRLVPLPTTSLTPTGGTLLNMTSLHLRVERDRAREEALGFVTHELRTPLVAIQGFAELMTRMPNAKASESAPETILRESRRLLALINSYLDVLRTDAGARPLRRTNVAVRKMVVDVLELLSPIAQASSIRLTSTCSEHLCVEADEPLLMGAVLNLVSNAIKYASRGSEVEVVAELQGTRLQLSVHNQGEPIADTHSVFEAFARGSKDEDRRPGWGLGLSLVKRIVEKHSGEIAVQSDAVSGTTFVVSIPGANAAMEVSTS